IIEIDGIPSEDEKGEHMIKIIYKALQGTLKSLPKNQKKETRFLEEVLKKSIRSAVCDVWGKKPICKILITVI
ncbi:MAG: MBL fold metallo-hydrolase, partial [Hyphomicrobium sp.]